MWQTSGAGLGWAGLTAGFFIRAAAAGTVCPVCDTSLVRAWHSLAAFAAAVCSSCGVWDGAQCFAGRAAGSNVQLCGCPQVTVTCLSLCARMWGKVVGQGGTCCFSGGGGTCVGECTLSCVLSCFRALSCSCFSCRVVHCEGGLPGLQSHCNSWWVVVVMVCRGGFIGAMTAIQLNGYACVQKAFSATLLHCPSV